MHGAAADVGSALLDHDLTLAVVSTGHRTGPDAG
jgi:hypothetical protein